jgi:hypothetical protein
MTPKSSRLRKQCGEDFVSLKGNQEGTVCLTLIGQTGWLEHGEGERLGNRSKPTSSSENRKKQLIALHYDSSSAPRDPRSTSQSAEGNFQSGPQLLSLRCFHLPYPPPLDLPLDLLPSHHQSRPSPTSFRISSPLGCKRPSVGQALVVQHPTKLWRNGAMPYDC